jgi:hypothetical protein
VQQTDRTELNPPVAPSTTNNRLPLYDAPSKCFGPHLAIIRKVANKAKRHGRFGQRYAHVQSKIDYPNFKKNAKNN